MVSNRARGLVNLHAALTTLAVGIFFWIYAQLIYRVPFIRLNRSVNLMPYFLCIVGGILLSTRELRRQTDRFHCFELGGAAQLAARQVGLTALLTFTMRFATVDISISRIFLASFLVWAGLGLTLLHLRAPRALARLVFGRGQRLPTVFIGRQTVLGRLNDWIAPKESLGIFPVGWLSDDRAPEDADGGPVPFLGRVSELARVLTERNVGQVVMLELPAADDEVRTIIAVCQEQGCRLLIHNDVAERYAQPLVPTMEAGRHFYMLHEEPLEDPLNRVIKRLFDLAIAVPVVVVILPPLCGWVAWQQWRQAPGPLFHARERRGLRGQPFRMFKFRSMRVAPSSAHISDPAAEEIRQARVDDERIYPFGRLLRRRSLDEFPQFWNVLRGEMSVVGPRPYMPQLDEEFRRHARGYRTRHLVKPGVTGLAQSLGYRGEILEREMLHRRVHWDVHYVTHWSVWLDLQITVRTLAQVFRPPPTAY